MFQFFNSVRVQTKGFGDRLNIKDFESDELILALNAIMETNSTYKMNIERASKIYKSQPLIGKELAGYWIDHVLKFGSKHFHSHAFDIPFYEYCLADVVLCILIILSLSVLLMIACLRIVFKIIFIKCKQRKQKEY